MLDFLIISTRSTKRGVIEVYPKFIINNKSSDLMIRGSDFYAIWDDEKKLWSTDEQDVIRMVDYELDEYTKKNSEKFDGNYHILHMWDAESGVIDKWHKYCQKQMRDSFHMLDEKLIFSNTETKKRDYASKRLDYPLVDCDTPSYDELMSTLYSDEERKKIEWAIGAVINGDSKKLQKFIVLYGSAGTGKSTVLNIIQQLFEGYYSVFDARALGSSSNSFALEAFKTNPLVAIQHDGDLSRIEDNTRLNSLVSHEIMTVNEKFKSSYSNRFKSFLFMGTNKPVKITDAKSGLIRRLIDVSPTGNRVPIKRYREDMDHIKFELGGIATHCAEVYSNDPGAYDDYIPIAMLGASNDFYNFVMDSYDIFREKDGVTLTIAWEMYKTYCDDAKVLYPLNKRVFKEELKNYFSEFKERGATDDGTRVRNYYIGFKQGYNNSSEKINEKKYSIELGYMRSIFDVVCSDSPAQYAVNDKPRDAWKDVTTKLSDLDTSKTHYVKTPKNMIEVDFDFPNEKGEKDLKKNLKEASKWPSTYAEVSKSGGGIHLHYIYEGDVNRLKRDYAEHIEIKVPVGNSSLRRKLTQCNNVPIATISSGLPLREEKQMINMTAVKNEKSIRSLIKRNLNKESHPGTKPSIDFIYKILDDAYNNGVAYDVSDMRNDILIFATNSTHQAEYCIKQVGKMHFKSENPSEDILGTDSSPIVFYDIEVFPNLLLVNWKADGSKSVNRMINPSSEEVEELMKFRLVGFNCRRYDNHILYARLLGWDNAQIFDLSQRIVGAGKGKNSMMFAEAYNISYTDVLDFSSDKKSLKKFEIELGIHHQELGLPWDKPVPEELWSKVAEYCDNDVIATEAVFHARKGDFLARQILADVAGMTVNSTTNSLTTKIIFEGNKNPQSQFNYRNLGVKPLGAYFTYEDAIKYATGKADKPEGMPYFPGYKYEMGKSTYRGEEIGEGGRVYAEPGMYVNVDDEDVSSMHPHSIMAEKLFGPYTQNFTDIVEARVAIKHKDFKSAKKMLGGKLAKYLDDEESAGALAQALKIAINSVYGLTSAKFENPFNDSRNKDNIVAKRGALFMTDLKFAVQEQGYTVVHIKTDSIKVANATPEIIEFIHKMGEAYGYTFETEYKFDRMCLVNDAVFIAKTVDGEWLATGTQFAVPYVFKKLFSKKDIEFTDLCETKSVQSSLYLDMNEKLKEDEHNYIFIGKVGQFTPVKPGKGGGQLMREKDGKYYAATGTKGRRWLESEMFLQKLTMDDVDLSYYDNLVDEAVDTISKFGDFEWFVSDDSYEVAA